MSWIDTPNSPLLERFLDLTAQRQTLIASNIANVDTPRYRTLDVDFDRELKKVEMQMDPEARAYEVSGLTERPDGNNVSLERETLLLAETQLRFRTAIDLLRAEFRRLRTAIHEGASQ